MAGGSKQWIGVGLLAAAVVLGATRASAVIVPDVVGLTSEDAEDVLMAAQLDVLKPTTRVNSATVPRDIVISQDPVAGASVPIDTDIVLTVSVGQVLDVVIESDKDPQGTAFLSKLQRQGPLAYGLEASCGAGSVVFRARNSAVSKYQQNLKGANGQQKGGKDDPPASLEIETDFGACDVDNGGPCVLQPGADVKSRLQVAVKRNSPSDDVGKGKAKAQFKGGKDGAAFEPQPTADDRAAIASACQDSKIVDVSKNLSQVKLKLTGPAVFTDNAQGERTIAGDVFDLTDDKNPDTTGTITIGGPTGTYDLLLQTICADDVTITARNLTLTRVDESAKRMRIEQNEKGIPASLRIAVASTGYIGRYEPTRGDQCTLAVQEKGGRATGKVDCKTGEDGFNLTPFPDQEDIDAARAACQGESGVAVGKRLKRVKVTLKGKAILQN